MEKPSYLRFKGSHHFRQRLLLSTLSQRSIIIDDIRSDESLPGLKSFEISLLRLIEKISDDGRVVINETGTKLKYKPGVIMGGKKLVHDCGVARGIGYFMEPLLILGLRGKKPLSITLKDTTVCYPKVDEIDEDEEKPQLITPEELGVHVAHLLLEEIDQVGVVDSANQGLLFLLCALCPEDFLKVRVSKLTQYGIDTLRHIRDFLGVTFVFEPDTETNTLIVKCRGSGLPNLSRRIH